MKHLCYSIVLCFLLTLIACSKSPQTNNDHSNQEWIAGWQSTSDLNTARAGAAVVVANGFIYVIGGVDGIRFLATTEYTQINSDGGLSPWRQGPVLNTDRGFIDAVVHDGFIFVVGGGNGPSGKNLLRSVERAKINNDGSLDAWVTEKTSMVLPRRCSKLIALGDTLYSLGGFGGALLDTVERVKFLDDGHLGQWVVEDATMTVPRYVNAVKGAAGNAFVIGGHDQVKGVGIKDVEWARPSSNGVVSNWQGTHPLQEGRYGLTSAYNKGFMYAIGGLSGLEYLSSIEVASVSETQGIGPWRYTTEMLQPRATFNAVTHEDRIYIIGGTNQGKYLRSVVYASVNASGDLGYWGTKDQKTAYAEKLKAIRSIQPLLPNEGIVTYLQHASMYSYVQVNNNKGESLWLAGPRQELKLNDKIRFSKGVAMSNFYSKELQRQFPKILFVSKIKVIK